MNHSKSVLGWISLACLAATACYPDVGELREAAKGGAAGSGPSMVTTHDSGVGDTEYKDSASPPPGGDAGTPIPRDCAGYAAAYCAKVQSCFPALVELQFGSQDICRERVRTGCELYDLPDNPWPSAACTAAYAAATCEAVFDAANGLDLPACAAPGPLAKDAPCAVESQCASRRCRVPAGPACGLCAARAVEGEACVSNASCAAGLVCGNKVCVKLSADGEPCSATRACHMSSSCKAGVCRPKALAGTACVTDDECDFSRGLICMGGQCAVAKIAQSCQDLTGAAFCSARLRCTDKTCSEYKDGASSCSDTMPCVFPAVCTNSVCVVPAKKTACSP